MTDWMHPTHWTLMLRMINFDHHTHLSGRFFATLRRNKNTFTVEKQKPKQQQKQNYELIYCTDFLYDCVRCFAVDGHKSSDHITGAFSDMLHSKHRRRFLWKNFTLVSHIEFNRSLIRISEWAISDNGIFANHSMAHLENIPQKFSITNFTIIIIRSRFIQRWCCFTRLLFYLWMPLISAVGVVVVCSETWKNWNSQFLIERKWSVIRWTRFFFNFTVVFHIIIRKLVQK